MSLSGTTIPTHTSHWSCICLLLWHLLINLWFALHCANWSALRYQGLMHVNGSTFTHPMLFQTYMISFLLLNTKNYTFQLFLPIQCKSTLDPLTFIVWTKHFTVLCVPKKESHTGLQLHKREFTLRFKHHGTPKPCNNNTACFMSPGGPSYISAPEFHRNMGVGCFVLQQCSQGPMWGPSHTSAPECHRNILEACFDSGLCTEAKCGAPLALGISVFRFYCRDLENIGKNISGQHGGDEFCNWLTVKIVNGPFSSKHIWKKKK